ncbi:MAG TPA: rod shape-determining protein [Candidatus Woesebacteria bacterium]|nr:rod shape-determining protein [Candidatus Woesebacteria bacterium]
MPKSLSKKIAIDLGSSKIRIVLVDDLQNDVWELSPVDFRAKVFEEAACLARRKDNHKTLAIGKEALMMRGRLDSFAEIVFPFFQSRIIDQEAATILMKELLKKVFKGLVLNPVAMVTTVAAATPWQRRTLSQFFYELGFTKVNLVAAPLAAAIGAGVPVADASGTLFLQMGASGAQLSSIALGSLLFNEDSDFGGDRLDTEIIDYLALAENFAISLENAELLKKQVFSLISAPKTSRSLLVAGKTANGGNPLELKIKSSDLEQIATAFQLEYESLIKALLVRIPPDLVVDVLQKGLLLSGGLAQINGLEDFLAQKFAFPVALLDTPDLLASMGAATLLKNIDLFGKSLSFDV